VGWGQADVSRCGISPFMQMRQTVSSKIDT
jgi:hypothetical protein